LDHFALNHLLASPGAIVSVAGELFRIRTLTPARKSDGFCSFLQDDRCTIHAVSPFGCALFWCRQTKEEADEISARGLMEVAQAWQRGDLYAQLWIMLYEAGRIAPSSLDVRARMEAALDAGG